MYKVTKIIDFCYGHRLLGYEGKCRYPHGHNGRIEIDLEMGHLDDLGMVCDFSRIKEVVKTWIDQNLDHRMLLSRRDPLAKYLQEQGEPVFLMDQNPTAEAIAELIFRFAEKNGFPVSEVRLWETPSSYATYNRSGLP